MKTDVPATTHTLLIALDGKRLTWQGKSYDAPCLIVNSEGVYRWPQ